jgi:hypothetical protein
MVNKFVIGTFGVLGLASCNYAVADTPCDYVKDVQTNWTQQIEKTENIERNVFPYVEDTRKCVMTMNITINGQTYPTEGSYVFGPDMTENNACDNATVNAKKSIISQVSPEILSAKTEMNCSTKDEMPVHVAAPQPKVQIVERPIVETSTVIQSSPVVTERIISTPVVTERIISRKVIDTTHSPVIQYIPNGSTITVGGFTIGFSGKTRERGKCYANWKTGGKDCY